LIPRVETELKATVPDQATFWTPGDDDIGDEGFGYFRDTWPILDVSPDDANGMLQREDQLLRLAKELAKDEVEFDGLAKALETGDQWLIPERLTTEPYISSLSPWLDEDAPPLDGLELGVAGLVYALASVGCFPAASCRSHPTNSWSDVPVVVFAADRTHTEGLAKIVSGTRCGFDIDPARPELLWVYAGSVEDLALLAKLVVGSG
jgi:hypothetical protein